MSDYVEIFPVFVCAFVQPIQFTYAQACDPAYVDFSSEGEVKIEPSSVEDTENIQCAVDEAIKVGKTRISLQTGEFLLGASISFVGFTGEFSGVSKANTIVKNHPKPLGVQQRNNRYSGAAVQSGERQRSVRDYECGCG